MLDTQTFKTIIENTPLVSIDLCLVCDGQVLLGKRANEPLKGEWFTPGGRIYKNETWQRALLRIITTELGLSDISVEEFVLMGVWDHFYSNSAVDQEVSTHYVNLPHYASISVKPSIKLDKQHDDLKWFGLEEVLNSECFHEYLRSYVSWLIERDINYD